MGCGRIICITAVVGCAAILASGTARADLDLSVSRFLDDPILLAPTSHRTHISGLLPVAQDVITEAEYNRLTGIRKRIGITLFGGMGFQGGTDAGRLRVSYSNTFTTQAKYRDLFNIEGTSFGAEVSLIVAPCYSIHLGGGLVYHKGKPFANNSFTDLYRYPIYLGLRLSAPLALKFDRWADFENPEFVTGLIPFIRIKIQAVWWNRVEISGSALPFYERSRDYFVQGLYPELFGGGGLEIRFGALAFFGEAGIFYQLVSPRMSKYFSKDPTVTDEIVPGAPFEFAIQGGITYYFGSGRLFYIMPEAD